MKSRYILASVGLLVASIVVSCGHISKRMPAELSSMHEFLTQDSPETCRKYHYNFERKAPQLYEEQEIDSLLDVIDYIKTECGPASNLEVTKMLLLAGNGEFADSLIGSATIPQMLWYRSRKEFLLDYRRWHLYFGMADAVDNTQDHFDAFRSSLADSVAKDTQADPTARLIGTFYSDHFDSAFSVVQSREFEGTAMRRVYDDFVVRLKRESPTRFNFAFVAGSWSPQGNNRVLGKHPDVGIQFGGENRWYRIDGVISYRFSPARDHIIVDSLGTLVSTNRYNAWLFGIDVGLKFFDNRAFSTDVFVGAGYDALFSVTKATDPEDMVNHGSLTASIGLRHRFFLSQANGSYLGAMVRYSKVDYDNPGGTDLSGNTLSIQVIAGWSRHATLNQFLSKLNYKGSRRP